MASGISWDEKKSQKDEKFKLKFVDRVLDNVHGYIELTRVERKIIELPIFTRLQSIKQLSLVNWVFPGAEHTRYIHSLGVMHIADRMAAQLKFDDDDRQIIRLASLLHDIGHYPFSHVGESVYMEYGDYKPSVSETFVERQWRLVEEKIEELTQENKPSERNRYHHEIISAEIVESDERIAAIIKAECPFIAFDDLRAMIVGDYGRHDIADKIQLLHSELDADRMDYLQRDSTFSGTSYGLFDFGVLIKNLDYVHIDKVDMYGMEPIQYQDGFRVLGIKPKGIAAADQFILNRFYSYTQIVTNRHVAALEFMLKTLIHSFILAGLGFPEISNKESNADVLSTYIKGHSRDTGNTFLKFTEHLFWNVVQKLPVVIREPPVEENSKRLSRLPGGYKLHKMANLLSEHREIRSIRIQSGEKYNSEEYNLEGIIDEYIILDNDTAKIKKKMQSHFKHFQETLPNNDTIPIFRVDQITKNLPKDKIKEKLFSVTELFDETKKDEVELIEESKDNNNNDKLGEVDIMSVEQEKQKIFLKNIMDGAVVIENGTAHMLIDDHRSILAKIYDQKYAVLRTYDLLNAEQEG